MKKIVAFTLTLFIYQIFYAQNIKIDGLKKVLANATGTVRINTLNELSTQYSGLYSNADGNTSLIAAQDYANQALALSRNINFVSGIANALFNSAVIIDKSPAENKQVALTAFQAALPYLKKTDNVNTVALCMQGIAESYHTIGKLEQAILYFDSVTNLVQHKGDTSWSVYTTVMKGHCYFDMGQLSRCLRNRNNRIKIGRKNR